MPQLCEKAWLWLPGASSTGPVSEPSAERAAWTLRMGGGLPELQNPLGVSWTIDFRTGKSSHRARGSQQSLEPIARAMGLAKLPADNRAHWHIVDGTAGAGADSWQLAASGATVTMVEQHPVLFTQLYAAIDAARNTDYSSSEQASSDPTADIAHRISVINASVETLLAKTLLAKTLSASTSIAHEDAKAESPLRPINAIYLDPMYPARRSKAAVKKPMQFIQGLVGKGPDPFTVVSDCLHALKHTPINRVVVKRPSDAPPVLAAGDWDGQHVTVNAGAARFDVYLTP